MTWSKHQWCPASNAFVSQVQTSSDPHRRASLTVSSLRFNPVASCLHDPCQSMFLLSKASQLETIPLVGPVRNRTFILAYKLAENSGWASPKQQQEGGLLSKTSCCQGRKIWPKTEQQLLVLSSYGWHEVTN
jgi:hypothetical protein